MSSILQSSTQEINKNIVTSPAVLDHFILEPAVYYLNTFCYSLS